MEYPLQFIQPLTENRMPGKLEDLVAKESMISKQFSSITIISDITKTIL